MKKSNKKQRIIVCPNCNSPSIRQESNISGWLLPDSWVCDVCGYKGILVKEIEFDKTS